MEDLRKKDKSITESFTKENRNITIFKGLKSTASNLKFKNILIIILILFFLVMFILYPNEIGNFIGQWIFDFYSGLVEPFK